MKAYTTMLATMTYTFAPSSTTLGDYTIETIGDADVGESLKVVEQVADKIHTQIPYTDPYL